MLLGENHSGNIKALGPNHIFCKQKALPASRSSDIRVFSLTVDTCFTFHTVLPCLYSQREGGILKDSGKSVRESAGQNALPESFNLASVYAMPQNSFWLLLDGGNFRAPKCSALFRRCLVVMEWGIHPPWQQRPIIKQPSIFQAV